MDEGDAGYGYGARDGGGGGGGGGGFLGAGGRGLHLFTVQFNLSALCGSRNVHGVFRGHSWRGWMVF